MGIKLLNAFLRKRCKRDNKLKSFYQLKNKTIVVDINVYLYRFKSEGLLMENMFNLCGIFHYYNIKAVFVFDGKAPAIKQEEIERRKEKKKEAKEKFDSLDAKEHDTFYGKKLRRCFVMLAGNDYYQIKQLIVAFGMSFITANGEADKLCAEMVICGNAYACLSEDTDLFVYGCPIVLRYLSITNHTIVLYDLNEILKTLNITLEKFQKICILSGTDYSKRKENLYKCFDLYKNYPITLDAEQMQIYKMYQVIPNKIMLPVISNKSFSKETIETIMKPYNFIFT
tara:strand:+ start:327 stop:1178 length:852 start_codon:yes stop_codon:yes gene_type:complete